MITMLIRCDRSREQKMTTTTDLTPFNAEQKHYQLHSSRFVSYVLALQPYNIPCVAPIIVSFPDPKHTHHDKGVW